MAVSLAGCSSLPAPIGHADSTGNPAHRLSRSTGALGVAAGRFEPRITLDRLSADAELAGATGAGRGAMGAFDLWLRFGHGFSCSGSACGAILAAWIAALPVFLVTGAIVGAAMEGSQARSPRELDRAERAISEAVARFRLQHASGAALRDELVRLGHGVASLPPDAGPTDPEARPSYSDTGVDAVLETAVLAFGIAEVEGSSPPRYALELSTRGRLVRAADGGVVDELTYRWRGGARTSAQWIADEGQGFAAALGEGVARTAEALALELLLLYYPPASAGAPLFPDFVLKPEHPGVRRAIDLRGAFSDRYAGTLGGLQFDFADSLRPELRWESFPRPRDLEAVGGRRERISGVVYDIRIHRAVGSKPVFMAGPQVIERNGLIEPRYVPDSELEPCQRYQWTVRARFLLDGQPRVTEWGTALGAWDGFALEPWQWRRGMPAHGLLQAAIDPAAFYYPFRAPPVSHRPGSGCS